MNAFTRAASWSPYVRLFAAGYLSAIALVANGCSGADASDGDVGATTEDALKISGKFVAPETANGATQALSDHDVYSLTITSSGCKISVVDGEWLHTSDSATPNEIGDGPGATDDGTCTVKGSAVHAKIVSPEADPSEPPDSITYSARAIGTGVAVSLGTHHFTGALKKGEILLSKKK